MMTNPLTLAEAMRGGLKETLPADYRVAGLGYGVVFIANAGMMQYGGDGISFLMLVGAFLGWLWCENA